MAKEVILRKGNSDESIILTIPRSIADMYSMKIGTKLELIPYTTDTLQVRILK